MYDELVKELRDSAEWADRLALLMGRAEGDAHAPSMRKAADAIEELLKAAKAMHTWIFLNSLDEQAAYDECGLTDEMNSALGYGGQFVVEARQEANDGKEEKEENQPAK